LSDEQHAIVFRLIADLPPALVVAVLFAPAGVAAGRLYMTIAVRADPHVRPRRWNRQRFDARELVFVFDGFVV
jgi:hypothetical protein